MGNYYCSYVIIVIAKYFIFSKGMQKRMPFFFFLS